MELYIESSKLKNASFIFSCKELYVLQQDTYSKITSGAKFSLRYLVLRSFKYYEIVYYTYFISITYKTLEIFIS